ncbi:MAG TPA: ATP-binding protein [Methylomirabilota bacterium]|nr:ATP-binding protein [Methylomirabilota bacterium]
MRPRLSPLAVRTRLTLWYTGMLLAILLVISGLSYAMLRWSLMQDLDASLIVVAQVVRDTGYSAAGPVSGPGPEAMVRDILGPEFYDKFFRLIDPEGGPGIGSTHLRDRTLPLSAEARRNAARGLETFETVRLVSGEPVRLFTMPIRRGGQLVQLVQVGMSLHRAQQTLGRYLQTLLALIPLGLGLAAAGGAVTARVALAPVGEMSRSARRISAVDLSRRLAPRGSGDELDHLAETLNAMLERLEGAFGELRRFAADAAHELRTPLTALKGGIEVALRADRSAEEYRRVLRSSLEEVERLIRVAEDLLLLSRSSAGVGVPRGRIDLEPLVLDVLDVGTQLAHGTGVTLSLSGGSAPAVVVGDAADLRRALLNLLENAIKYTAAGGTVELSLTCADGYAAIAVRDTGSGIDPADADRVFQPFVRLDAARARATGGSGLGLPIARSIVRAHGGTLTLQSVPGDGSCFTIRLPLA